MGHQRTPRVLTHLNQRREGREKATLLGPLTLAWAVASFKTTEAQPVSCHEPVQTPLSPETP